MVCISSLTTEVIYSSKMKVIYSSKMKVIYSPSKIRGGRGR